ncbi:MAG: hypothetical protein KBA30_03510 [Clostridia bacterium]|nr:hypothetical protein [Clostridia bacterium]
MTPLPVIPSELPVLFLVAAVGIGAPLFTLPGLLPHGADDRAGYGDRAVRAGLRILALALPAFLVCRLLLTVLGGTWTALTAPIVLFALFDGLLRLESRIPGLRETAAGRQDPAALRISLIAAGLALYPVLDPGLSRLALLPSLLWFTGSGCGMVLYLAVVGEIHDRMRTAPVPACMKGTPALLVAVGLVGMACLGFVSLLS